MKTKKRQVIKLTENELIGLVTKTAARLLKENEFIEARAKKKQQETPHKTFKEALDEKVKEMLANRPGWNTMEGFYSSIKNNDDFTFEDPYDNGRGVHTQSVYRNGQWYGTLIEKEQNFLLPVFCTIVTPDVEKIMRGEEGDSEFTLMGHYYDMIGFDTFDKFVDYINKHQKEWQTIREWQKAHGDEI